MTLQVGARPHVESLFAIFYVNRVVPDQERFQPIAGPPAVTLSQETLI
jgi:hypothetical protein